MLTVVSESLGRSQTLIDVVRELSLSLSYFNNIEKLDRLMSGKSRRFVILGEADIRASPTIGATSNGPSMK